MSSPRSGSHLNSSSVNVQWTASDNGSGIAKMEIKLDTGSWNNVSGTNDTLRDLSDGVHIVTIKAIDNAGNWETVSRKFVVDTVAPNLLINSPTSGLFNNTGSMTVNWVASDQGSGIANIEISTDGTTWNVVSGTNDTLTVYPKALTRFTSGRLTMPAT